MRRGFWEISNKQERKTRTTTSLARILDGLLQINGCTSIMMAQASTSDHGLVTHELKQGKIAWL
jgi:uncharacterized membrane protein SirB2